VLEMPGLKSSGRLSQLIGLPWDVSACLFPGGLHAANG